MRILPVILAGGEGKRLWPLSKPEMPKQFLTDFTAKSIFQSTIERNNFLGHPLIIGNLANKHIIEEQLIGDISNYTLFFESFRNNTLFPIITAILEAEDKGYDTIVVLPSDHYIQDLRVYQQELKGALETIKQHKLCLLGLPPQTPNTGYGYIKYGDNITPTLHKIEEFTEKPSVKVAEELIKGQKCLWNSGIYIFDVEYIKNYCQKFLADIWHKAEKTFFLRGKLQENKFLFLKEYFSDVKPASFDKIVAQQLSKGVIYRASFDWLDIGDWKNYRRMIKSDKNNNQLAGNISLQAVKNCLIKAGEKKTTIIGLKNIVIINDEDHLFIAHKTALEEN